MAEETHSGLNEQWSLVVSILSSVGCLLIWATLLAAMNCMRGTTQGTSDIESVRREGQIPRYLRREEQLPAYERPPSYKTKASSSTASFPLEQ